MNKAISKKHILILLFVAFLLRFGYWSFLGHPTYAADTPRYIECAQTFANGDIKEVFARWPLYQLYPLFLSPVYIFDINEEAYIKFLHIIFSVLTVLLLYHAGRLLISHRYGLWVALLAVFYPLFVFWLPYVMSETAFLFFFTLFIVAFLRLLKKRSFSRWAGYLISCIFLLIARPVSVPILAVSTIAVGALFTPRFFNISSIKAFKGIIMISAILLTVFIVLSLPYLERSKGFLGSHQLVQNLYRSTTTSSNNMDEQMKALEEEYSVMDKMSEEDARLYKTRKAVKFIFEHPILYLRMALRRFTAFWYPWMFAVRWSIFHLVTDFFISLALTLGVLAVLFERSQRNRLPIISLIAMAFSLAIMVAFGHIETDGRLRLPAELIFLLIAPYGLQILLHRTRVLKIGAC